MQHRIEHNEVTVDTLQRRDFMRELISNGRLAASKRSTLSFEVSGTIAAIAAKNGSRVGAGEPIARIDTSDYALQLHKARLALDKARLGFYDVLVGQGYQAGDTVTPPAGVMQLARIRSGYADATASLLSARRSLAHCTLREMCIRDRISNGRLAASKRSTLSFEVSGTIAAIAAKNGSRVGAGEPIARIDTSDYALQLHKARLALDKARLGFYDVLVGQGYQAGDTVTPPAGVMQLARIRSGYADATASLLSARRSLAHCTLQMCIRDSPGARPVDPPVR